MIKQPWLFGLSMILLLVAGAFALERLRFLRQAEKVQGTVTQIMASDGKSSGGKGRRSQDCTRFTAEIRFATRSGGTGRISIGAGSSRGHGQSISHADYRVSQTVPVVYDPRNMAKAYQNSLMGVWDIPIYILVAQFSALIASLSEARQKKRREWI